MKEESRILVLIRLYQVHPDTCRSGNFNSVNSSYCRIDVIPNVIRSQPRKSIKGLQRSRTCIAETMKLKRIQIKKKLLMSP